MNVQQIIDETGQQPAAAAYLFCPGKPPRAKMSTFEPILAEHATQTITDAVVDPANRDFAYTAYYADETPAGQVVLEAQTLPFLADRRVVIVRNAEKYNTESAAGPLIEYLANPNESTVLLLIANKVDKRTKFYKACKKAGEIVECPALKPPEIIQWVRADVRARGIEMESDAVRALVDRAGAHLSDVINALTNVIDFVGDSTARITEADVNAACADVAEEEIWALTDAIAASRGGVALEALSRLTDLGKHPDEIIGTINWLLKSAYAVAVADGEPAISPFVAKKVRPLAEKLGLKKVRAAFALCTDTQFAIRSTGTDSALALELLVIKLAAPMPRRRAA